MGRISKIVSTALCGIAVLGGCLCGCDVGTADGYGGSVYAAADSAEREIYRSDFNSGVPERFTATNGANISVVDFNGEKVLKCSDRGAWWSQISLDLSGLTEKDCDYEVKCRIYFEGAGKSDCTIEWFDANGAKPIFRRDCAPIIRTPTSGWSFGDIRIFPAT